jgi:hypothetical protein
MGASPILLDNPMTQFSFEWILSLNRLCQKWGQVQGEIGASGGMGSRLGSVLTDVLMQAQPGGISSHLHYCWVYRDQIIIQPNDHTRVGRWSMWKHGSGIGQEPAPTANDPASSIPPGDVQRISGSVFRMPQIATTWEELCRMLDSHDLNVDGCIA